MKTAAEQYEDVSMPSRASTSLLQDAKGGCLQLYRVSMPSRASTSLLLWKLEVSSALRRAQCQCPHGLVPHCYQVKILIRFLSLIWVSMPSRASTSLLPSVSKKVKESFIYGVSMPSRASTSLLLREAHYASCSFERDVSMPSRASTSLLLRKK